MIHRCLTKYGIVHFQDKINLMTAYKVDKTSRAMNNNSDSYEFTSVNKMFVDRGLHVRQCMLDVLGAEIEALVRYTLSIYWLGLK